MTESLVPRVRQALKEYRVIQARLERQVRQAPPGLREQLDRLAQMVVRVQRELLVLRDLLEQLETLDQ